MLVITQREGEFFTIGENIKVIFIEDLHGKIRLGIEAPRDIHILRSNAKIRAKQKGVNDEPSTIAE